MKAVLSLLAAALAVLATTSAARAQYPAPYPMPYGCGPRCLPDACGPGFYTLNQCGCPFGPNYCLRPPFPPFNGVLPLLQPYPCGLRPQAPPPAFAGPMTRSPRDFFMYGQSTPEF